MKTLDQIEIEILQCFGIYISTIDKEDKSNRDVFIKKLSYLTDYYQKVKKNKTKKKTR